MRLVLMVIFVLCAALTGGVVVIVRAQPLAPLYGIEVCDGRPCVLGITPGLTTWAEAVALLRAAQLRESYQFQDGGDVILLNFDDVSRRYGRAEGTIHPVRNGDPRRKDVASIVLRYFSRLPQDQPHLAQFIARFGTPCSVNIKFMDSFPEMSAQLYYPTMIVHSEPAVGRLSLDIRVMSAEIDTGKRYLDEKRCEVDAPEFTSPADRRNRWGGFSAWSRYAWSLPPG
jgi:hypothetical protein